MSITFRIHKVCKAPCRFYTLENPLRQNNHHQYFQQMNHPILEFHRHQLCLYWSNDKLIIWLKKFSFNYYLQWIACINVSLNLFRWSLSKFDFNFFSEFYYCIAFLNNNTCVNDMRFANKSVTKVIKICN